MLLCCPFGSIILAKLFTDLPKCFLLRLLSMLFFVCLSFLDLTFSFARPVVVGYSRQTHACYDAASRLASEECILPTGRSVS